MNREPWKQRDWRDWLNTSWILGHLFGIEVRLHWSIVLMPLVFWSHFAGAPGLEAGQSLGLALVLTVLLYLIVYTHEMGHILAARRYGVGAWTITLSPMGGVAHLQGQAPGPRSDILISLAGPATHLLWLLPAWLLQRPGVFESWPAVIAASFFFQANLMLMIFNLLPFYPMDGGRVLQGVLALRGSPGRAAWIAARVGLVGGVLLALFGVYRLFDGDQFAIIFIALGLSNFITCRQTLRYLAGGGDLFYEVREPWQQDTEAWRHGGELFPGKAEPAAKPGLIERLKSRRTPERPEQPVTPTPVERDLEPELDRILAKISDVGMPGLTDEERATLQEASAQKKARQRPSR